MGLSDMKKDFELSDMKKEFELSDMKREFELVNLKKELNLMDLKNELIMPNLKMQPDMSEIKMGLADMKQDFSDPLAAVRSSIESVLTASPEQLGVTHDTVERLAIVDDPEELLLAARLSIMSALVAALK